MKISESDIIEFWKSNEKPFGLCPKECQEWLRIYTDSVLALTAPENGIGYPAWKELTRGMRKYEPIHQLDTYRLPADYQPEKRGRWVECPVEELDDREIGSIWGFTFGEFSCIKLSDAPGMVGFGGVKYEGSGYCRKFEWKGEENGPPSKPLAVRFWVEE